MKKFVYALIFLALYLWREASCESRTKRYGSFSPPIVYPFGGTFKNATLFTEFFEGASSSRRRREGVAWNERAAVYRLLEEEFERQGTSGRDCTRKTICEAAAVPLKNEGLVEELLHLFLTPQETADDSSADADYLQAFEFGRRNCDCSRIYRLCPAGRGILDRISKVI